jgi:prophage tail gpP-like protein
LYATVAGQKLSTQTRTQQSLNAEHVTLQKLVLLCYKRKIVVVQGTETVEQKRRIYKELFKQINKARVTDKAIAICKLKNSNIILIINNKQVCIIIILILTPVSYLAMRNF